MFRENDNKVLWERVVKATLNNKDILPIIYYRPFKAANIYLKHRFPEMENSELLDDF